MKMKNCLLILVLYLAAAEGQLWMYLVNSVGDTIRQADVPETLQNLDAKAEHKLAVINSRALFRRPLPFAPRPVIEVLPEEVAPPKVRPIEEPPSQKVKPVQLDEDLQPVELEIIEPVEKVKPVNDAEGEFRRNFLKNVPRLRVISA